MSLKAEFYKMYVRIYVCLTYAFLEKENLLDPVTPTPNSQQTYDNDEKREIGKVIYILSCR